MEYFVRVTCLGWHPSSCPIKVYLFNRYIVVRETSQGTTTSSYLGKREDFGFLPMATRKSRLCIATGNRAIANVMPKGPFVHQSGLNRWLIRAVTLAMNHAFQHWSTA